MVDISMVHHGFHSQHINWHVSAEKLKKKKNKKKKNQKKKLNSSQNFLKKKKQFFKLKTLLH